MKRSILSGTVCAMLMATAATASAEPVETTYKILVSGTEIGDMVVSQDGNTIDVDYEYRNNGRGPTLLEAIELGDDGLPVSWTVSGASTFGNQIDESFVMDNGVATWTDSTGTDDDTPTEPSIYVAQSGTPYALSVYANALLADFDNSMPALPAGNLSLQEMESFDVTDGETTVAATSYALIGSELDPTYFVLDDSNVFMALITPEFLIVREGFEGEDERLRALATRYATERFEQIQADTAHVFDAPVRIRNVRVFDPATLALSEPSSVVVDGDKIVSIDPLTVETAATEYEIDGAGGTLIAGLSDMHAHLGQNDALLNIAAGVTFVRDMGNDNAVLSDLIAKIEAGTLAGPRVIKSGFIEGKSPFSSNNGEIVSSQEEALDAVRKYGDAGDFFMIKIYNSMKGEWVPEMVELAHDYGMRVAGHVPAFSNANQMIEAGYDELTHINQVMLGWVLTPEEDTRSLLRLTALQRLPVVDLDSEQVTHTLDLMVENDVSIDPTIAIHEALLLSRNGEVQAGVVDYIDHMPIGEQRSAKQAWSKIETDEEDAAYAGAFAQIIATVKLMKDRGIFIIPGTDLGGAFTLHRELELYQQVGYTPAELLALSTQGMADYVGMGEEIGSIEPGKLADFFVVPGDPTLDFKAVKTISMVMKDGVAYFPTEIYPSFGIEPFTEVPTMTAPSGE